MDNDNAKRFDYLDRITMASFLMQIVDELTDGEYHDKIKEEFDKLHKENEEIMNKLKEIERKIIIWS